MFIKLLAPITLIRRLQGAIVMIVLPAGAIMEIFDMYFLDDELVVDDGNFVFPVVEDAFSILM